MVETTPRTPTGTTPRRTPTGTTPPRTARTPPPTTTPRSARTGNATAKSSAAPPPAEASVRSKSSGGTVSATGGYPRAEARKVSDGKAPRLSSDSASFNRTLNGTNFNGSTDHLFQLQPGFQKWRPAVQDKAFKISKDLEDALKKGEITSLREALNRACHKDMEFFFCESRLVGKVIKKIHEITARRYKRHLNAGNLAALIDLDDELADDPAIATLWEDRGMKQIRALMNVLRADRDLQETEPKEPKARGIWRQQNRLKVLNDAIEAAKIEGVDEDALAKHRLRQQLHTAVAKLHSAIERRDSSQLDEAIDEAKKMGIDQSEIEAAEGAKQEWRLDKAVMTSNLTDVRRALQSIRADNNKVVDEEKIAAANRIIVHEELKAAMARARASRSGAELAELRQAINNAKEVQMFAEKADTLSVAEELLNIMEEEDAREAAATRTLLTAAQSQDPAKLKAALAECEKRGVKLAELDDYRVQLCELEVRLAMERTDIEALKVKVPIGFELKASRSLLSDALKVMEDIDPKGAAWSRIRGAIGNEDVESLIEAIRKAEEVDLEESNIEEAKRVLEQLRCGGGGGAASSHAQGASMSTRAGSIRGSRLSATSQMSSLSYGGQNGSAGQSPRSQGSQARAGSEVLTSRALY